MYTDVKSIPTVSAMQYSPMDLLMGMDFNFGDSNYKCDWSM